MNKWVTILGGAQSGKTDFAEDACRTLDRVVWWGTAQEQPQEPCWQSRLQALRDRRPASWVSHDGPWTWPEQAQGSAHKTIGVPQVFVMDCLNLWLAAHIHRGMALYSLSQLKVHLELEFKHLVEALTALPCHVVVVSAEVGCGVVPSGEAGRLFRDLLTTWNRNIVKQSDFGVTLQAGRAFLWPAGRTPADPDGTPLRCIEASWLSRWLTPH